MKLTHVATVALDGQTGDAWMVRSGAAAGGLSYTPIVNSWAITITDRENFQVETLFEILEQAVALKILEPQGSFETIVGMHIENLELSELDGLVVGLASSWPDMEHG